MSRFFVKDRAFYRLVLTLAIPVVLQNMITIGVNIMDTMMLGSYGETQLSASSLANEFINIYQILCMGMGGGAAVLTAQYWGKGDIPALRRVVTLMLWITLFMAGVFTAVTACFPAALMGLYTDDAAIIEKGVLYFRVSALTYPLMGLSLTLTIVLRSVRQVKLPLVTSVIAFFVNIFFNWVLIYGRLGAPELQIEGAAWGTVIARVCETAIIVLFFFLADQRIGYRLKHLFRTGREEARAFLRYSLPVIASDSLLAFGNNMVAVIMGHMGAGFVAANAIVAPSSRLATVFNQGVCNAAGVITGNTLGEGDREKAYRQGVTFTSLSVFIGILAAGVVLALDPVLIENYQITAETRAIAYQLTWALAAMIVFQTVQSMLTKGVLRSGGDTRFLLVADAGFLWLASIPLGYLTGLVLKWPPFWVYTALKADWIIKSVWCVFRLKSRKWMKRV